MRRPHRWLFSAVAVLFAAALARDAGERWVVETVLPPLAVETSVEVLARDGSLLRAFTVSDGRWRLEPGAVDPAFLEALVTYEDRRFYRHEGVDPWALLRAAGQAALNGRVVSGGSTLTMQVARLLEESGTGRVAGKLRQIRVALALERRLNKAQILDLYLRLAPYGGNLEGLRAATLAWFGKEPHRLTPAEIALLIALPQSPEARRPDRFPQAARAARSRVLARMGWAGLYDESRIRAAETEPVPALRRDFPSLAPHLAQRLHRDAPSALRIATTLDAPLQRALETLASEAARQQGDRLSLAMLVADHRSGEILASVGSPDWTSTERKGFVDMTQAARSPGSTLKPFVYGLAFDDGLAHPETLIDDKPVAFNGYAPQNFDRMFRGTIRLREALTLSLNIPVVVLTNALGPARLMTALKRAGMAPKLAGTPGLAMALGGVGVSLQDLVQGYAALARMGAPVLLSPLPGQATPLPQRLFGPVAAWEVANILSQIPPPPGAPFNGLAYKTGTSYGHRDAWALGFDGAHVAGVWLGRPDGTPVPGAFGADVAAPLLFQAFGRLKPRLTPLPPPPPATLLLPNAQLPQPLQRFRPRGAALDLVRATDPEIAFPPEGAALEARPEGLVVKVRGGSAPYTWLANGSPAALAVPGAETLIALPPGREVPLALTVIDATGASASVTVSLRR